MIQELVPGKYVVAVSGGVDSVVLLDMLTRQPGLELIVAHFDHGIRSDSKADREFVEGLAKEFGLPFYYAEGRLGNAASEALARSRRYEFLYGIKDQTGSTAIITAHHQDDLLETAIINLIRGTNRRGLSSLKSTETVKRPLLDIPKAELIAYAKKNGLKWQEDSTNSDESYLRNYVRRQIIAKMSSESRERLIHILSNAKEVNAQADKLIGELLKDQPWMSLERNWFISLPHDVAKNVLLTWFGNNGISNIDARQLEWLTVEAKTLSAGKTRDVKAGYRLKIYRDRLALVAPER
jgi:tRNA(Ile)-lysidine synthase